MHPTRHRFNSLYPLDGDRDAAKVDECLREYKSSLGNVVLRSGCTIRLTLELSVQVTVVVSSGQVEPTPMTVIGAQFMPTRPSMPSALMPRRVRSFTMDGSLGYNKIVTVSHR